MATNCKLDPLPPHYPHSILLDKYHTYVGIDPPTSITSTSPPSSPTLLNLFVTSPPTSSSSSLSHHLAILHACLDPLFLSLPTFPDSRTQSRAKSLPPAVVVADGITPTELRVAAALVECIVGWWGVRYSSLPPSSSPPQPHGEGEGEGEEKRNSDKNRNKTTGISPVEQISEEGSIQEVDNSSTVASIHYLVSRMDAMQCACTYSPRGGGGGEEEEGVVEREEVNKREDSLRAMKTRIHLRRLLSVVGGKEVSKWGGEGECASHCARMLI